MALWKCKQGDLPGFLVYFANEKAYYGENSGVSQSVVLLVN